MKLGTRITGLLPYTPSLEKKILEKKFTSIFSRKLGKIALYSIISVIYLSQFEKNKLGNS